MIEIGDPVTLSTTVYAVDGVTPADATLVVLTVTAPDQTASTPAVNHPGFGLYNGTLTVTQTGTYLVSWVATGTNAGAQSSSFEVESSLYGIVSLEEVKARLNITRTTDDDLLRTLILEASDLCESSEGTGKVWRRTVVTGEKANGGGGSITFLRRPVLSVTSMTIDGAAATVSDYDVESWRISSPYGTIGAGGRRQGVTLNYIAGATSVPNGVRQGVIELVRHLYGTKRGGSNLPRQEEPDYTESLGYLIPNRVAYAWRAYRDTGLG